MRIITLFILIITLNGRSGMKPIDYIDQKPRLIIEDYLSGNVKAWGILQNRSGKVIRQFSASLNGKWDGEQLVLDEKFNWSDGEVQERQWKIKTLTYLLSYASLPRCNSHSHTHTQNTQPSEETQTHTTAQTDTTRLFQFYGTRRTHVRAPEGVSSRRTCVVCDDRVQCAASVFYYLFYFAFYLNFIRIIIFQF